MPTFLKSALAAGALSIFAISLAAQTPPPAAAKACEPNQSQPAALGKAVFYLQRAREAANGGNPAKELRDAIASLSAPANFTANPAGTNYLLAQAYMQMLSAPGATPIMRRADIGLTTNPDATINLYAAIDTVLNGLVAAAPECANEIASVRRGAPWANVTNAAINALNAGKLDSAEIYANWSLNLSRGVPYAYSVLASVAKTRNNRETALTNWKKVLELAGTDTTFSDVRMRTYFEIATDATLRVDSSGGAAKKAAAREAISAWNNYINNGPTDFQTMVALQNLNILYSKSGDTTQIQNLYAPMLANPSKFGELSLFQAAVLARQYRRVQDAIKLFEAALQENPYQRDALYNLAASYIIANQYDTVIPLVGRLVAVDPNNPDNVMLFAYIYQGLETKNKDRQRARILADSSKYYTMLSDKMPLKVTFNAFTRGDADATVSGTVENRTATPKTYNITLELLDKTGAAVATQQIAVGPIPGKGTKDFSVTAQGKNIVAYRYKPII